MIALNLANHSLSFSTCTCGRHADQLLEVLGLGRIGRIAHQVGGRRQAGHDARQAKPVEPDLLRLGRQGEVDVLLGPVELVLGQALGDPQPVGVELAPSSGTVHAMSMPFFLASRALVEMVQAASISPFWNQVVKSGILAQERLLRLQLRDELPGGLHVARNVLELAAARNLRREVHADTVVVEGDAALELRIEQVLPRLGRAVGEGLGPVGQHIDIAIGVDDREAFETDGLRRVGGVARFGRSDRSSVTPRRADLVAFVVVSQLMWIGGTRPWSTAAQTFGWISLSSVRSWRTAMPVAAVKGSDTPFCSESTHEPPQARTMISAGFSGSDAHSARPGIAASRAAPPIAALP